MVKMSKFYYKTKCIHELELFLKGEKENLSPIALNKKIIVWVNM